MPAPIHGDFHLWGRNLVGVFMASQGYRTGARSGIYPEHSTARTSWFRGCVPSRKATVDTGGPETKLGRGAGGQGSGPEKQLGDGAFLHLAQVRDLRQVFELVPFT